MRELAFGPAPCRGEATASRQPAFAAEAPSLVLCHSKSRRDTTASLHTCIQGSVLRLFQHAAICPALLPTCWLASPRTVLTYNLQFLNRQRLLQVGLSSPSPGPDPGPAASPAWTLCVTRPGPLPGPHSGMQPLPSLHQRSVGSLWGPSLLAVSPCESHSPFWSSFSAHRGSNPVPFPSGPPWASPSCLHFLSAWL